MNVYFTIPFISLMGGILTLVYHFRKENTNLLSNVFISISLLISLIMIKEINTNYAYSFSVFNSKQLDLVIKLQIDNLTIIMLLMINFISFIIHKYSTNYLASDITQGRFMAQLSMLTAAVSSLVISGNLLTAFISWQFIGVSLYMLLNHYHYDDYANKTAKKKFIINRIGDLSFLIAVVLCYRYCGNSDFAALQNNLAVISILPSVSIKLNTLVVCLIFLAVMTKSAQFPFHIWLPDTMETPTPVSAIMHAGVINAGGLLLTRMHPILATSEVGCQLIFTVGFISIVFAAFFMLSQTDVKKQLAYSTMGQMGFMVVQCSLGLYSAAIFHLIAHGFFKAFLFLSAGNNLKHAKSKSYTEDSYLSQLCAPLIFGVIFVASYFYLVKVDNLNTATLISTGFIALTITNIYYEIIQLKKEITIKFLLSIIVMLSVSLYYYFSVSLANILGTFNQNANLNTIDLYKVSILSIIIVFQLVIWLKPNKYKLIPEKINLYLYHLSRNKLFIEEFYRYVFLNPYRRLGDLISTGFNKKFGKVLLVAIVSFLTYLVISGIQHKTNSTPLILFNEIIFIMLIASANRALNIRLLNVYILIAQLCLVNIGVFSVEGISNAVIYFQLINSVMIFLALELICNNFRKSNDYTNLCEKVTTSYLKDMQKNTLNFSNLYFCILLFLWIGLPCTATFISEINIIYALSSTSLWLLILIALGFIMLAVAILHALQEHVFSSESKNSLITEVSYPKHMIIIFSIIFNIINGLYPYWLLAKLS